MLAFPPPSEGINPAEAEELVIASLEAVVMQDNAESPQHLPPLSLFTSRLVTSLNFKQTLNGEMQSVTHEEVHYTPKELLEFSNLCKQLCRICVGMNTECMG